eukprot:SAG31_NODE_25211_length_466_cov_0.553134_1_plen_30_part_10
MESYQRIERGNVSRAGRMVDQQATVFRAPV